MHRKLAPTALDESLPSPLTSANLPPRSVARSLRSASSSRASRASSSLSNSSSLMPAATVAAPSPRGTKRERSDSPPDSDRKRVRGGSEEQVAPNARLSRRGSKSEPRSAESDREKSGYGSSEEKDVDELEGDVETILLPSDILAASGGEGTHSSGHPAEDSSGPSSAPITLPMNASPHSPPSSGSAGGSGSEPIVINSPTEFTIASGSKLERSRPSPSPTPTPRVEPEPLSSYSCPICFFPPTNATLTPCGHVCCGSCLFTAVKTMMQRGAMMPEASDARCPVCRAQIPGWDGRGGGVIGLKIRAVFSL